MLGPIIVSFVGVGLPVGAGIWLAPTRNSGHGLWMLVTETRSRIRSLMIAAEGKIQLKHLPAPLRYDSTLGTGQEDCAT
jgi:hypothetical protein